MNSADINLFAALPALSLSLGACVLLLVDAFVPRERKVITAWLSAIGVIISLVLSIPGLSAGRTTAFNGMFIADPFTALINIITCMTTLVSILVSYNYLRRTGIERGEYYPLVLFSAAGAMFMGAAGDLVIIFVGLELLSIPLYILAGMRRPDIRSEESSMKYFLLGAFATGFLVYGIALVYGAAGNTNLQSIFSQVANGQVQSPLLLLVGSGLLLVALGFKVAAVPFHMWTPDVYQGAPTPVTAFMSVVAKVGGFGSLLRLMIFALPLVTLTTGGAQATNSAWQDTVSIIAGLTMIVGNVIAISQRDIKRLLAYSSIAHGGYMMMAVAAAGTLQPVTEGGRTVLTPVFAQSAMQGVLIYLLAYMFTNIGAFAVAIAVEHNNATGTLIDDFAGLGQHKPWLAAAMTLFMFSLAGIPLTAGFTGKWFVFLPAINANLGGLAFIGVITSLISVYYYLRVVVKMWLEGGRNSAELTPSLSTAVFICTFGTLLLGIIPPLATRVVETVTAVAMR